ncbi:MAG: hypothetical protein HY551_04655 [Elusimicrobia bacterium]|nr:hypothetical protein [Elusimicrobiota bacterium]
MKKIGILIVGLLCASVSVISIVSAAEAPYYRLWRGARLESVPQAVFLGQLNAKFIPALPNVMGTLGVAVAYFPALPPAESAGRPGVFDEYALIAYRSRKHYEEAARTPQGAEYGRSHQDLFDMTKSKRSGAIAYSGEIVTDVSYDVSGKRIDWQAGHATFFVGRRNPNLSPEEFYRKLKEHVEAVSRSFGRFGLDGYVFVADNETETAYQHWPSAEAANSAFQSPEGQQIVREAGGILIPVQFSAANPFDGNLQPGQVANVRFPVKP